MKNQTHLYLLADARKALQSSHLLQALQSLQGLANNLKAWNESEEITGLKESYGMMLNYLVKGADDPARLRMYTGFVRRSFELCDSLERVGVLSDTDSFYTISRQTLLNLSGNDTDLQRWLTPDIAHRNLFDALWTAPLLSSAEEIAVTDFLANPSVDVYRKSLALSALTLSAMRFFDIAKYRILLDYALDSAVQLRVRAMVGLVFVHQSHPESLKRYPDTEARLRLMGDVPGFVSELEMLQAQLFLTLETKRIERNLQDEIIPRMMKRMENLRLDRSLGLDELKEKLSEVDLNPEWEVDGTPSKLAAYMKEFAELQQRGADMYMSSFKMLKQRFSFFSVAVNWFWPFTLQHPELPASLHNNSTLKLMLSGAGLCDSDKYSFCLVAAQMPQQSESGSLQQQMAEALKGMQGIEGFTLPDTQAELTFKDELRSYVQGFYRFCTLYTHREAFVNPFTQNLFLPDYAPFVSLLGDAGFLMRMAELAFTDKSYTLASTLLQRIPADEMNAGLYQKLGYCKEHAGLLEEALLAYTQANDIKPHSAWTLGRLAACLRKVGRYEQALNHYSELAEMQPEKSTVALRQAECLIRLERYDEAFKALFKVIYLNSDSLQAERAIAWCSLLTGKYEQADRYYCKVLEVEPTLTDWLNAGHVAWLQHNMPQAVERYRKALPPENPADFLTEDAALLLNAGLTTADLAMMTDAVLADRY